MVRILKQFWEFIKIPYNKYKAKKELDQRIAEMKKRDPFIYK
jgi:hypothetical protein